MCWNPTETLYPDHWDVSIVVAQLKFGQPTVHDLRNTHRLTGNAACGLWGEVHQSSRRIPHQYQFGPMSGSFRLLQSLHGRKLWPLQKGERCVGNILNNCRSLCVVIGDWDVNLSLGSACAA